MGDGKDKPGGAKSLVEGISHELAAAVGPPAAKSGDAAEELGAEELAAGFQASVGDAWSSKSKSK